MDLQMEVRRTLFSYFRRQSRWITSKEEKQGKASEDMLTPGILGGRDTGTAALLFFLADYVLLSYLLTKFRYTGRTKYRIFCKK